MKRTALLFTLLWLACTPVAISQRGKNGPVTISASTIVNEFTYLTVNAVAGATSITVNNNNLNTNGRFSAALGQGDLILIIQMQGASMNANPSFQWSLPNDNTWGGITAYNNAGNYEFCEVVSVMGSNTITISCGLLNAYTASGHVQIVRVPRYTTLTVNNTITTEAWNGNTGGIIAVESDGVTTINAGATMDASALGFRGGDVTDNVTVFGGTGWGSSDQGEGAPKGEGIAGFTAEYGPLSATYCRGAPANAGGGGNGHNCGGGGGSNAGDISNYNGYGNPNATTGPWTNAWNQESPGFATNTSSGGGRGGNSHSTSNQNATTLGPGQGAWGGDLNRNNGGQGGWPLDYSTGKLFMGGGGGAGEQNEGDGGDGGRGGGMVFIIAYNNITGSGTISANGQNGVACDNSGGTAFTAAGLDGAGGAGGGGTIYLKTDGTVANTLTLNANGGTGGNNNFAGPFSYNPAYGPGGGGGGGYIAVSAGTPTRNANGGANGTSNSTSFTEFVHKGATRGGVGINNAIIPAFDITLTNQTICAGQTATITATINGTPPAGTLNWYATQFGSAVINTGTTFITPALSSTTTYYVGYCPGNFRIPVTITVSPAITINTAGILIGGESCAGNDGSINGITVTGGSGALTYDWNGTPSPGPSLVNAGAGNYTLTVSDGSCSASAGAFTIPGSGGPAIDLTNMVLTGSTCYQNNGSITGITATGTGSLNYSWNGTPSASPDILNIGPGTYTLTVTDGSSCSSSAGPFTLTNMGGVILDTTFHTITNANCGSNTGSVNGITVTASTGSLSYAWNGTPTPFIDLTSALPGSYTLEVTDGWGCSETTGPYIVGSVGGATIDNSGVVVTSTSCGLVNGSITGILVSGGTAPLTFEWNGATTAAADTVSLGPGSYTLTVTDGTGCVVSDGPYTINPSNTLTVSATGNDASCNGYTDGDATAVFAGGNGGETYQWQSGPSTAMYTGLGAGTYTVVVTDTTGCADTTTVTITEPAPVVASINGTTTICAGNSTTLTATGGGTYTWNNSATTSSITVSPAATTAYNCIVTVGVCSDTASVTVTVNPSAVISILGPGTVCENEPAVMTATGGLTYTWNTGDTTATVSLSPAIAATYTVIATNACGIDTATYVLSTNPAPTVSALTSQTIPLGGSANLTASGASTYTWFPSGDLSCSTCAAPVATPAQTTTYMVIGEDGNGCRDTGYVTITIDITTHFFVPDIFSPDGNGTNDILYVRGSGIEEMTFRIFDRWGQKVFESNSVNDGWDGTFQGKPLNTATFIFTLDGTFVTGDTFSKKGNITLRR